MNKQLKNRFRTFFRIGFLKTLIVNFRLLPFKQAIHLPIVVSRATIIENLSGNVVLKNVGFGQIKIGTFHTDLFSWNGNKSILNIKGRFFVGGFIQFGVGCSIIVDENSELHIGNNACIGANTKIICRNRIVVGDNFRTAWDVQLFDTNFHYIKNIEDGSVSRREKEVIIGNNNWFGNRCTVMPGTKTNDFFIAASNSLCNKDYTESVPKYSLVAGQPARLIKQNVVRVLDREEKEIKQMFENVSDNVIHVDPTPRPRY